MQTQRPLRYKPFLPNLFFMKKTTALLAIIQVLNFSISAKDKDEKKEGQKEASSAEQITDAAWSANLKKNYDEVINQTEKCIKLYEKKALKMQKSMSKPVPTGAQGLNKEAVMSKWALNSVGTCYFLQGRAYENMNKPEEALKIYQKLTNTLSFAQCWDPNGWFWKPAIAAKKRIKALESE